MQDRPTVVGSPLRTSNHEAGEDITLQTGIDTKLRSLWLQAPHDVHLGYDDFWRLFGTQPIAVNFGEVSEAIFDITRLAETAGRASAVGQIGALSDLDNITVRIADVAANLAVLRDRLRDELRSSTFP